VLGVDVAVRLTRDDVVAELTAGAERVRHVGDELSLLLPGDADVDAWLERAHAAGAKVVSVTPRHETLESFFLKQVAS